MKASASSFFIKVNYMKRIFDYIKTKSGITMIITVTLVIVLSVSLFFSIRYLSGVGSNYEFNIFTGEIARYTGTDKNVQVPTRIFGRKVVKIGVAAFEKREDLESVKINPGLITVEDGAFNGCTNLREVVLPDTVSYIGHYTFLDCKNLRIILPESVSFIGKYAF